MMSDTQEEATSMESQPETEEMARQESDTDAPPAAPTLEELAAERDKLLAERAELQDLLLRRQADFDNFRKRVERDRTEAGEYAAMYAVLALLPVLDDFERALRAAAGADGALRDYVTGTELIWQRLTETLGKLGLESVPSTGARFDPNIHNAVQREEREDLEDQTIIEEFQRGYTFKGRLLRPAMVKVAVKP